MTRRELEAIIWQAMRHYQVTAPWPIPFADTILKAADDYATTTLGTATEGRITAARRAVLAHAARPKGGE